MKYRLRALLVVLCTFWASVALGAIKKGPYLQSVTGSSVMVVWETDASTTGKIQWGTSQSYGFTATDPASGTMHAVTVDNLSPGTTYYYKVENDTVGGTFTTAPAPDQSFTFVVFGDNRTNEADHQSVVNGVIAEAPTLVLNSGDVVETATNTGLWQTFFDVEKELLRNACSFYAVGNHELTDVTLASWQKWFYLPTSTSGGEKYYSFDWGNSHFAVLDSFDGLSGLVSAFSTNQQNWLKQDLTAAQANADIKHIFTVMHQGPYSNSNHGGSSAAKTSIVPILTAHSVDMTFAGHDHDYERGEVGGLRYMVSGGGGAPLYSSGTGSGVIYSESTLHYVAFSVDGDRVDGCAKKPDGTVMECFGWGTLPPDGGTPDAGHDAGVADAGADAGHDTGTVDAGHADAGKVDVGQPDSGEADAGQPEDTGTEDVAVDASHGDSGHGNDAQPAEDTGETADTGHPEDAAVANDAGHTGSDTGGGTGETDSGEGAAPGESSSGCSCSTLGI